VTVVITRASDRSPCDSKEKNEDSTKTNRSWGKKGQLYQTLRLEVNIYSKGASVYGRNKRAYTLKKRNAKKKETPDL
jgi:hypothetical protein